MHISSIILHTSHVVHPDIGPSRAWVLWPKPWSGTPAGGFLWTSVRVGCFWCYSPVHWSHVASVMGRLELSTLIMQRMRTWWLAYSRSILKIRCYGWD